MEQSPGAGQRRRPEKEERGEIKGSRKPHPARSRLQRCSSAPSTVRRLSRVPLLRGRGHTDPRPAGVSLFTGPRSPAEQERMLLLDESSAGLGSRDTCSGTGLGAGAGRLPPPLPSRRSGPCCLPTGGDSAPAGQAGPPGGCRPSSRAGSGRAGAARRGQAVPGSGAGQRPSQRSSCSLGGTRGWRVAAHRSPCLGLRSGAHGPARAPPDGSDLGFLVPAFSLCWAPSDGTPSDGTPSARRGLAGAG